MIVDDAFLVAFLIILALLETTRTDALHRHVFWMKVGSLIADLLWLIKSVIYVFTLWGRSWRNNIHIYIMKYIVYLIYFQIISSCFTLKSLLNSELPFLHWAQSRLFPCFLFSKFTIVLSWLQLFVNAFNEY